jgi:hypothetical protein
MRKHALSCTFLACAVLFSAPFSLAGDADVRTMAEIVLNLNHFPSDADKEKLAAIIDNEDSSEDEVTIATAILNVAHQASESDKEALDMIVTDDSVSPSVQALASAVLNVSHKATDEDIAKLKMIASGS